MTTWTNERKRIIRIGITVNQSGITVNQSGILVGGINPATTWTFTNKTP